MTPTETHQLQFIAPQQRSGGCERANTHHDTEDAVRGGDDRVARPAVLCEEEFRRDGIEHAVHDVASECVATVPAQQGVRRARGCAREEEDAGDDWRGWKQVRIPNRAEGGGDVRVESARVPLRPI